MAAFLRLRLRPRRLNGLCQKISKRGLLEALDCKSIGSEDAKRALSSASTLPELGLSSSQQRESILVMPSTLNMGRHAASMTSWHNPNCNYHSAANESDSRATTFDRQPIRHNHQLSNEWLAARLMADRKRKQLREKRLQALSSSGVQDKTNVYTPSNTPSDNLGAVPRLAQPPLSQPLKGSLEPTSEEEEKLAPLMARPDLLITRNVEWANLAFGFEQQNRYIVIDPRQPHAPVGYILEESAWLLRQLLRTRRSFVASVLDANGAEIFRVRRPIWLINSAIYVEVDGKVIGEAHRRWHLWRRIYDLYLGTKQFATVENPGFWYWTFTLKDKDNRRLAEIDRNWRGFGYEFFTDAGQYVIRFGDITESVEEAEMYTSLLPGQHITTTQPGVAIETTEGQVEPFVVDRSLSLLERAVALALAVSLDNDYFSRHSGSFGGFHMPIFGSSDLASTSGTADDGWGAHES